MLEYSYKKKVFERGYIIQRSGRFTSMESFVTVENISEMDFLKLQSGGWVLVSVDSAKSDKLIYSFKKGR